MRNETEDRDQYESQFCDREIALRLSQDANIGEFSEAIWNKIESIDLKYQPESFKTAVRYFLEPRDPSQTTEEWARLNGMEKTPLFFYYLARVKRFFELSTLREVQIAEAFLEDSHRGIQSA